MFYRIKQLHFPDRELGRVSHVVKERVFLSTRLFVFSFFCSVSMLQAAEINEQKVHIETSSYNLNVQQSNIIIKGKVTDTNGEPIIGATVKVVNTNAGAITDANGNFSIKVPANAVLEISL